MNIRLGLATIVAGMLLASTVRQDMYGESVGGDRTVTHAEQELFNSVNQARLGMGLSRLRWDEALAQAARRHAILMAAHNTARHGFDGEPSLSSRAKETGARFHWLSENVTQGPSPAFIHLQFMNSPAHRAILLDPDMDSLGVGVVEERGQLFAVEDFSQAR